jgi:hypothetical protein
MRQLVGVALVLSACGGKSTPSKPPGNSGGSTVGPPYAALFEAGKSVRYKRVHETSYYDPDDPKAEPGGNVRSRTEEIVSCAVNARDFGEVKVAQLSCDGLADGDGLASELTALYVADLRGVWRADGASMPTQMEDARAAVAEQTTPLLAAEPKPFEDKKEDEGEEGFGEMRKVSQTSDGAWCNEWGSWGGDEGGGSICFAAGKGITKVSSYFAGGSTQDDWFELVP